MRKDVLDYINQQPQLKQYIRQQPHWYRRLSRNPNEIQTFEISSMHYYKKTIPHKVEKISNSVQMASMMMSMFQAMNNNQT